eukprot:TRINITY_DN6179_c0_g1_i2.p1 TRINITY_DN6179_c0_g1~~TRINITY_DN6179_c0_g1_i2.p1  ORF type:complete len:292 (+),score=37.43 TRINITY_DN6179_c0_g1_i2:126-1001(+)
MSRCLLMIQKYYQESLKIQSANSTLKDYNQTTGGSKAGQQTVTLVHQTVQKQSSKYLLLKFQLIKNEIFYPQKIIYIDASDDWIRERLKKIGGHEGTHFSDEGVCRRMPVYRKLVGSSNNQELIEYFEEKGAKVISIQLNEEWEQVCEKGLEFNSEILAKIKDFIESEGKFKVYEKWVDEREPLKEQQQEQKEEIKEKSLGNLTEINVKQLKSQQEMLDHNMRFLQIQQKEIDILDSRSKPIRQYLSDLVLPSVIEGLIQVTKFMPQDPIDFLSNYLMEKCENIEKFKINF